MNYIGNMLNWASGKNNFQAIGQVFTGSYKYNRKPSLDMKVKQVGSEIMHAGAKWSVGAWIASQVIDIPKDSLPGAGAHMVNTMAKGLYALSDVHTLTSTAGYASGIAAGIWGYQKCLDIKDSLNRAFSYSGGYMSISWGNVKHVGREAADLASVALPVITSGIKWGSNGMLVSNTLSVAVRLATDQYPDKYRTAGLKVAIAVTPLLLSYFS